MKTGFIAFAIAAVAPLSMALPFPQAAPGGFFPPPPSINGTQPGNHGHYGGGQNGGPGSWLPVPGNGQQPVPTPGPTPTPPPMVPVPPPSASTPPAVPQPPPAAPTEPIVAPTPTPFARK
ncbi:uncharacterized protein FMAN_09297 [Fusarium mangiferae]|uniref:Uncharacterized protein n=1 Tax=Fusarium mangiferae TaxID=192010 RepID=A0A1L7T776_FUSMA|nr:uncharacterized protein FMAN_09297 [Fusarium mangiferae]CVK91151.1 uncharacterized protein FMAN_09297 [Fusarium mangiferae]